MKGAHSMQPKQVKEDVIKHANKSNKERKYSSAHSVRENNNFRSYGHNLPVNRLI